MEPVYHNYDKYTCRNFFDKINESQISEKSSSDLKNLKKEIQDHTKPLESNLESKDYKYLQKSSSLIDRISTIIGEKIQVSPEFKNTDLRFFKESPISNVKDIIGDLKDAGLYMEYTLDNNIRSLNDFKTAYSDYIPNYKTAIVFLTRPKKNESDQNKINLICVKKHKSYEGFLKYAGRNDKNQPEFILHNGHKVTGIQQLKTYIAFNVDQMPSNEGYKVYTEREFDKEYLGY